MATSSNSSFVVDLGDAADLDDATSRQFFSDTCAAGAGQSAWPAASETISTLTSQDSLAALCSKHGVPSELTPFCAHQLGWKACTPPTVGSNKLCVYAGALEAGLRFPLHDFYNRVLRRYHLAPSQLAPNAWTYLAAFVLLCHDAGVEPLVSAFRYFFTICGHKAHDDKPMGFHHFRPYHDSSRRLFTGVLPSRVGWKSKFFFLNCPSGWKFPVKWGKPRREDVLRAQLTDTVIEKLKHTGCVDIKVFLANREMPVGDLSALAPPQSALKAEAAAVGAAADNASTRKRSRLSPTPPAVFLSQPQHLPTSAPAAGLAPLRASSTGGRSGHIPPTPQQQCFGVSSTSAHRELPGMRARAQAGGSSEVTPPAAAQTMCVSDALQLWEAKAKANEQAAMIAKLNQDLHRVKTWNTQWQQELRAAGDKHAAEMAELVAKLAPANDRNNHLMSERGQLFGHLRAASVEVARLQAASVDVVQLKAEQAAESAQLKKEQADEAKQLREELVEDAQELKHEGYTLGASDMRDLALGMYKDVISPDDLKVELLLDYNHHQAASPLLAVEDQ